MREPMTPEEWAAFDALPRVVRDALQETVLPVSTLVARNVLARGVAPGAVVAALRAAEAAEVMKFQGLAAPPAPHEIQRYAPARKRRR